MAAGCACQSSAAARFLQSVFGRNSGPKSSSLTSGDICPANGKRKLNPAANARLHLRVLDSEPSLTQTGTNYGEWSYPLADDLMEPLRAVVDLAAARHLNHENQPDTLTKEVKRVLLEALLGRYCCDGEQRTLFDLASRTPASLCAVFAGESDELLISQPV